MNNFPLLKYFLLLIPSAIIVMILWSVLIDGSLFYCSDKVPFLDFIPPFVHGSQTGDYYIVPESLVWVIWILFIAAIFIIPFVTLKQISSKKK